jgi:hypothetical protein
MTQKKQETSKENENPTTLTDRKKRGIVGSSNIIQMTKDIVKKHQTEVTKMKKRIHNKSIKNSKNNDQVFRNNIKYDRNGLVIILLSSSSS